MHLIVGLGNPGAKYAANRHNVGMMAIDAIARHHNFAPFKSKFRGVYADGSIDGERTFLLKPETYMNKSGDSVEDLCSFFKIPVTQVTVIYDELDLVPGKLRVKRGGGHGGHNGLRSIDPQIGKDYARVRIGIGHPGDKNLVSNYVLSDFSKADQTWLDPTLDAIATHANLLVKDDAGLFMNRVSAAVNPQHEKPKTQKKPTDKTPLDQNQENRADDKNDGPKNQMADMLKKLFGDKN